jgi:hypothetical protein
MAKFKVSNYHKKTVEEHEYFMKEGKIIIHRTGYRGGTFFVETNDDHPPHFEYEYVPGGDGKKDSINMYDCCVNNIENVELESLWDGCWEDVEFPDSMTETEQERLKELIERDGLYQALEEQERWDLISTDAWMWGPILIEDENDNKVKIIIADDTGKLIDFKEDE